MPVVAEDSPAQHRLTTVLKSSVTPTESQATTGSREWEVAVQNACTVPRITLTAVRAIG